MQRQPNENPFLIMFYILNPTSYIFLQTGIWSSIILLVNSQAWKFPFLQTIIDNSVR